jgi:uncharacterized protein
MELEWDEEKRRANLAKHRLDFVDAGQIFSGSHYSYVSSRPGEERWVTIGLLDGREVAVVWTARGDAIGVISFRGARHEERRQYRHLYP